MEARHLADPVRVDAHARLIDTGLYRPRHTACYLLESAGELAFIDCGAATSVPRLLKVLEALGHSPEAVRWILPTHVHLDHAGGAGRLLAACPHATLATHHRGLPHLIDPGRLQAGAMAVYGETAFERLFGTLTPAPEGRCQALEEGDRIPLGDFELQFLDTPGHANHHGCFFDPVTGAIYTGDTFGLHYAELDHDGEPLILATTTPVAFDPAAWQRSLDAILALNPSRACLTHFGPLEEPARWAPALRHSLEQHRDIALAEEANPEAGREARLRAALEATVLAELPEELHVRAEELLAPDLELNAQGLAVWLARRAKHRR